MTFWKNKTRSSQSGGDERHGNLICWIRNLSGKQKVSSVSKLHRNKTTENKLPVLAIWGKDQYWEKEKKEHREIFSSCKNRAVGLKNIKGMCMLQPARMKRIEEERRGKCHFRSTEQEIRFSGRAQTCQLSGAL